MGLDISHGTWRGAYSAFNTWRTQIAKCIGIPLSLMEGFYPTDYNGYSHPFSLVIIAIQGNTLGAEEQFKRQTEMFPLKWEAFNPSPLHELLNHSDCDGEIEWQKCGEIASALEELIPKLPDKDFGGHVGLIKETTHRFVAGLRLAHNKKENLKFE